MPTRSKSTEPFFFYYRAFFMLGNRKQRNFKRKSWDLTETLYVLVALRPSSAGWCFDIKDGRSLSLSPAPLYSLKPCSILRVISDLLKSAYLLGVSNEASLSIEPVFAAGLEYLHLNLNHDSASKKGRKAAAEGVDGGSPRVWSC